jgi:thiol-disulfide isomerase/thioredoxin
MRSASRPPLAGVAILLAAATLLGCPSMPDSAISDQEGQMAPAFELAAVDGSDASLDQVRGSQATLIDFWATWCAPCLMEMPHLQALYNKYRHKGFEVVGIACDSDEDKIPGVVKERGVTYTNLICDDDVSSAYDIRGYPTIFLLDGDGRIVKRFNGTVSTDILATWVEKALTAPGAPAETS